MASKSKKYREIKKDVRDVLCLLANEPVDNMNFKHLQIPRPRVLGEEGRESGDLEEATTRKSWSSDSDILSFASNWSPLSPGCLGVSPLGVEPLPTGSEDEKETSPNSQGSLSNSLRQWAVKYQVPHTSLTSLLSILQFHGHPELPRDGRTLLQSLRNVDVKKLGGGEFVYLGIEQGLNYFLKSLSEEILPSHLNMQVNVDGLPVFKSSSLQFWPILGLFTGYRGRPFLIPIYAGRGKPKSLDEHLGDFVEEAIRLQNEGTVYNLQKFYISISAFICDAPARAYIKCVKSFSGYFGCERCTQEGLYVGSTTFPYSASELRTNESFLKQLQEHHTGL